MPNYSDSSGRSRHARRPEESKDSSVTNLDGKIQQQARKMLMDTSQLSILQNNLRIASLYVNGRHLEMLSPNVNSDLYVSNVCEFSSILEDRKGITVFKITKFMYNEEENSFEKLVSVYSAMNNLGGIIALIIQSDGVSTKLYMCTNVGVSGNVARDLLANNLKGQFPGCEIVVLDDEEKNKLLDSCGMKGNIVPGTTVRSLSMIPGRREDEKQNNIEFSAQGYEKFIDAMNGNKYTLVVISQCISSDTMDECLEGLEALYTSFSPYSKETATYGENETDSVTYSVSTNINTSTSSSISKSFGTSHTNSISEGHSSNNGHGYDLFAIHFNSGSGSFQGSGKTDGITETDGKTDGKTDGYGSGEAQSSGTTTGINLSLTICRDNKAVQNLLMKIEEHIRRISLSQTFGMWNTACYVIADDVTTARMGTSILASLFSGDSQSAPRAYCNQWDVINPSEREKVLKYIENLQHPVVNVKMKKEIVSGNGVQKAVSYQTEKITPAVMISGKEIPIMMGLPRKSVPGIVVDSMAEFGRNVPQKWKHEVKRPVLFGNIYHMGQVEKTEVFFDLDTFASHMFICGTSGSGKSNTTYNLLQKLIENKIPFLVIEPAKGEYKFEFADLPGINIFTAEESSYRRLQINPFEFMPGIHIQEHLDNIIQVISACWPLYGAMPGLLKQAFEKVYFEHGWDLEHSERIIHRGSKFPVFSDLITALEQIIDESPYSVQTKGDYKGALLNRISSLCNGFEGQIFGRSIGIPDSILFSRNTIIDLSSIGSDETRSLIMGILITKIRNYRKVMNTGPNSNLIHVTILEEAHNILKRCSKETNTDSANIQGAAIGSLCKCIAEMRSSGEGFVIIDQSPSAVDDVAIKNSAIKICMRLPSKNDCEEVGAALSLRDDQIRELSRLETGIAAVYHAGWPDAILAKMGNIWDRRYRQISRQRFERSTYIKLQGAIVQLMYYDIQANVSKNIYEDVKDLLEFLCRGSSALKPILSVSKQQELLGEVKSFLECNEDYLNEQCLDKLKYIFFEFVFNFVRLKSIMNIFPLFGVSTGWGVMELTDMEVKKIVEWERKVREGISKYLYMPLECNPKGAYKWPIASSDAEFFWQIYKGVLYGFCVRYKTDSRYVNAFSYLEKIGHFN